MSYMVVLTVDDIEQCPDVLDAWEEAGVSGVTILSSTGLGRFRRAGLCDDMPMMPNLHDFFRNEEEQHRTLFSVVETQEMVDKMVGAAQKIIGDLNNPHTGFMFVLPVSQVYGFGTKPTDRSKE
jgi:nitrogen regulatory protein P-II 1